MSGELNKEVAIIGIGCTKFGEHFTKSWADLAVDAAFDACADAGVELKDVEAAWLGSYRPWIAGERNTGSPLAEALGLSAGQLFGMLRSAVTGKTVSPPLFESMEVIGKAKVLERIRDAIAVVEAMQK